MADDPLAPARQALDRGEYGRCLRLLEPLAAEHPATTSLGGSVRLLMVTALLGQGNSAAASACCRTLRTCTDRELRARARELQEILDAPPLRRPENWSITLPSLDAGEPLEGRLGAFAGRPRRDDPPPEPPPPVGPTRSPLGFALVVALVVLLLTTLLAGCLRVDTDIDFASPGRLRLEQRLVSEAPGLLPWQRQLQRTLQGGGLEIEARRGTLLLRSGSLTPAELSAELARVVEASSRLGGLSLPPPVVELRERNWLLGVDQRFVLEIDLRELDHVSGLSLQVGLGPLTSRAVRSYEPWSPEMRGTRVHWPLAPGAINRLQLRCWRWNRLGVGGLAIGLGLVVALLLQGVRRSAGYGWPELPPPEAD
jgi:hypothetical protein